MTLRQAVGRFESDTGAKSTTSNVGQQLKKETQALHAVKVMLEIGGLKEKLVLAVMRKQAGNCWWIKYKPQQHYQQELVQVIV